MEEVINSPRGKNIGVENTTDNSSSVIQDIAEYLKIPETEFVQHMGAISSMLIRAVRLREGQRVITRESAIYMLQDPIDKNRKNPWVQLPGIMCEAAERGTCAMCNFAGGNGRLPTTEDVEDAFGRIITSVEEYYDAYPAEEHKKRLVANLSSVGSWFSDTELPPEVRNHCYEQLIEYKRSFPERTVVFTSETRLDGITPEKIQELKRLIDEGIIVEMGVGIESSSFLIRESIINKELPNDWRERVKLLQEVGVGVSEHMIFGVQLLTPEEQIAEAISTAKDILATNPERVIFMIMNQKPGTLVNLMVREGLYHLPSIFLVAETLIRLGRELSPKDLRKTLVFGLYGPTQQKEAGSIYLESHGTNCPCHKVFGTINSWQGKPEDVDLLKQAFAEAKENPRDCPYWATYTTVEGRDYPFKPLQAISADTKGDALKERIVSTYSKLREILFPHLQFLADLEKQASIAAKMA